MIRVRSNWPSRSWLTRKYAWRGGLEVHAGRDVDEGSPGPDRRVERGELVVGRGNDRPEVLAEELGVVLEPVLDRVEDHPLGLPLLLERVVDHLGVVLGAHAGQDLPFGLGDAEPLEGLLDAVGHVVPGTLHLLLRLDVEVGLVQRLLKLGEVASPLGHRLRLVDPESLQAALEHPFGLVLARRNLPHDVGVESRTSPEHGLGVGYEAELVVVETQTLDEFVAGHPSLPALSFPVRGQPAWTFRYSS